MMILYALTFAMGAILAGLLGATATAARAGQAPQAAQAPRVTTASGFHAEEVRVGGSCVVIVSRAGTGASDYVAAVPCDR